MVPSFVNCNTSWRLQFSEFIESIVWRFFNVSRLSVWLRLLLACYFFTYHLSHFYFALSKEFDSTIIESFPTSVRYTGMAIAYNIGYGFFGGITPLVATTLIKETGNLSSPGFYLMASALISLIAAVSITNMHGERL